MRKILLLLCLILLTGCSDKTPVEVIEDKVYLFPLDENNTWSYRFQRLRINGVPDSIIDTSQLIVSGKAFDDYYAVDYTTTFQTTTVTSYYKNNDEGLWIYNTNTSTDELMLTFPGDSGDVVLWRGFTIETISTDSLVVVDSNSFECYHYHLSTGDSSLNQTTQHIDYFYAKNVGMIIQLNRVFSHNVIQSGSIQTLLEYSVM